MTKGVILRSRRRVSFCVVELYKTLRLQKGNEDALDAFISVCPERYGHVGRNWERAEPSPIANRSAAFRSGGENPRCMWR